jgi:hypothetical protein
VSANAVLLKLQACRRGDGLIVGAVWPDAVALAWDVRALLAGDRRQDGAPAAKATHKLTTSQCTIGMWK